MRTNEIRSISVTMKNTGTNSWDGAYRLGAGGTGAQGCPDSNEFVWSNFTNGGYSNSVGDQRCYTADTISPNSQSIYSFDITAPAIIGTHHFVAKMVHDGVAGSVII